MPRPPTFARANTHTGIRARTHAQIRPKQWCQGPSLQQTHERTNIDAHAKKASRRQGFSSAACGARADIPGRSRSSQRENGSHEAAALACYSACGRTRHPQQGRHITALTHSSHHRGTSKCAGSIGTCCNARALRLHTRACIPTAHSTLKRRARTRNRVNTGNRQSLHAELALARVDLGALAHVRQELVRQRAALAPRDK